jgi:hypothetical protein
VTDTVNHKLPEDTLAAQDMAHEQLQRARRNRVSSDVIISTTAEYRTALVEAFYKGVKHGQFVGTRELASKLSQEEDWRRRCQAEIDEYGRENE